MFGINGAEVSQKPQKHTGDELEGIGIYRGGFLNLLHTIQHLLKLLGFTQSHFIHHTVFLDIHTAGLHVQQHGNLFGGQVYLVEAWI